MARNEKGEATSQTVEVTELPPEEKPKGEKPKLTKLTNIVSILSCNSIAPSKLEFSFIDNRRGEISRFHFLIEGRR